ncbi:MAG: aldo/keto reductase [bacterium]
MKIKNRVGLGTFPLAGVFDELNDESAIKITRSFLDNGGYFIDTAPLYGFGRVEKIVGKSLKDYLRDDYFITTKCGYVDVEGKNFQTVQKGARKEDVIRECELSLKRLGLDDIDLYLVHSPDKLTPFDETIEALEMLQGQGKVREIGVSNVNLAELKDYNRHNNIKYVQNRFSLINRSIDDEFEKYLLSNNVGLVPYQVIDRGQLTESALDGFNNMRIGDLRQGRSDWKENKVNVITNWVKESIYPISRRLNITISQLSIAWALNQKYVSFVIIGATKAEHVPLNLIANSVELSTDTLKEIDNAYLQLENQVKERYNQTLREFRGLNEKYY